VLIGLHRPAALRRAHVPACLFIILRKKVFFFEKKKQKTFIRFQKRRSGHRRLLAGDTIDASNGMR